MALLSNKCRVLPSVLIDLAFEDDIRKQYLVHENDIVSVVYNKAGLATRHVGKVTQIGSGDFTTVSSIPRFYGSSGIAHYDTVVGKEKGAGDYMVIDGSGDFAGNVVVVYLNTILDFSMISQYDANLNVTTVKSDLRNGIGQVTDLRIYKGYLQFSTNYGQTWHTIKGCCGDDGPTDPASTVTPSDAQLAAQMEDLIDSVYNGECQCNDNNNNDTPNTEPSTTEG